ncbi:MULTISPECIES: DUF3313 domain-containing protein [unclassified Mesorhizobium]|uniref:DUF3313 domain-containing protein n=1 Tax=unclassified Mesorhizobium TaxID=325217 RepID=UPI002417A284|nr:MULTISPECIES: DUF3313 domain-containing protein [unclassified Mesorhizobium]MDG4904534.1 DUF3313 domain-containing protein [Mesorhizobium sp. WSM4962]MDG4920324.1 DUF3313 domain-containing protein [Mesorhizobium sp. WSM4989]
MILRFERRATVRRTALCGPLLALLSACANVPLQQGTSLSSYAGMTPSGGMLTKAEIRLDPAPVLTAQTVSIVPTSAKIASGTFEPKDLALVTNTIDRALCTDLSDRFLVVAPNQPADLVVHATVTNIVATNRTAAAASTVASLGATVALPVPIPRLPIGLGGLAIEAEAVGRDGSQKAAMVWSRGANMITTGARVSSVGDAYSLSSAFSDDFSKMLVKGKDPFKGMPAIPSMQRIRVSLGGKPKYDACNAFGRAPGIPGAVAGQLGLPPAWTDKGAAAPH